MSSTSSTPFPDALAHLKPLKGWVVWKYAPKPGKPGEFTKRPFNPRLPEYPASNRKEAHWGTFAEARKSWKAGLAEGVGFIVSVDPEIVWIDLDDCRDPETGALSDFAQRMVRMSASYTEITPSGRGLRIVGRLTGNLAAGVIHRAYKIAGGQGEVFYRAARYVTITGKRLPETPDVLADITETVSAILVEAVKVKDGAGAGTDLITLDGDDLIRDVDTRPALNLSHDQIRSYLKKLPPHDATDEDGKPWWTYDRYYQTVFAVKDDTDGSEDGFALVDEWCQGTPYYDPDGLRKKWDSARGNVEGYTRVSFRTVIKWANDWTKPQREASFDDLMGEMARANNRVQLEECAEKARGLQVDTVTARAVMSGVYRVAFKRVTGTTMSEGAARKELAYRDPSLTDAPRWARSLAWVTNEKKFYDAHTGLQYDAPTFDLTFGHRFMTPEEIAQGADTPSVSPSATVLNRYKIPIVAGLGYMPVKDKDDSEDELDEEAGSDEDGPARIRRPSIYSVNGVRYVNLYHTRGAVPAKLGPWTAQEKEDIRTILALYLRVCGTERERDLFLSFLRYILLERKRVPFCPVFASAERSGKTTAGVLIPGLLFGAENVGIYGPHVLLDKSDGSWMYGHLYKVIEELLVPDYAKTAVIEKMKPVITNAVVSPRFMYQGTRSTPNTASYVGLTNHHDAIAMTAQDTRFFPIQPRGCATKAQMDKLLKDDPDFYVRVNTALRSIGAFRGWLETKFVPHPDFDPTKGRAPESETKDRVIDEMRDPLARDILDILDMDLHPLLSREIVCLRTLMRTLAERGVQIGVGGEKKRTSEIVSGMLRRLDFRAHGQLRLAIFRDGDDLEEGPPDARTRIYTSGVGRFDDGNLTAERLDRFVANGGL